MVSEIEGQVTLMEYIATLPSVGTACYKVNLADISEYVVDDIMICGGRTVYLLKAKDIPDSYELIHFRDFGRNVFLDYASAAEKGKESPVDAIFAKDMVVDHFHSYSYVRKEDGQKMIAFYAVLDNGLICAKDPNTPQYIINCTEEQAAQHCKDVLKGKKVTKHSSLPPLKNMYRCKEGTGYLFTEATCNLVAR